MFRSQSIRTSTRLGLLGLLVTCLWYSSGDVFSQQTQDSAKNLVPIETTQLQATDGVIPVTLRCQTAEYPKPQEGKALRCVVANNSDRSMTAVSLAYSITYETEGEETIDNGFIMLDALVHPDFRESNLGKFIHPGSERTIQRGGPLAQNATVLAISVSIDFAEFESGSTIGQNSSGSHLKAQREGADTYRRWLRGKYLLSGRSMPAMAQFLENNPMPLGELKLEEGSAEVGARAYQKNARDLLIKQGAEELKKKLADAPSAQRVN